MLPSCLFPNDFFLHTKSSRAKLAQLYVTSRQFTLTAAVPQMAPLSPLYSWPLLKEAGTIRTFSDLHTAWCAFLPHPSPVLHGRPDSLTSFSSFSSAWVPFKKMKSTETERASKSKETVSKGPCSHTCRPQDTAHLHLQSEDSSPSEHGSVPGGPQRLAGPQDSSVRPGGTATALGPSQYVGQRCSISPVCIKPMFNPRPKNM